MSNARHELKHYINDFDYIRLKQQLALVMQQDQYSSEDNGYLVRSLYFDNYNDKALLEKINGINEREKFRLRLYNGDTSLIKLEKKSKINGMCYKNSTSISKVDCLEILNGNYSVLNNSNDQLKLELYLKMNYQQLRPKNIVEYKREAYVFSVGNVRATIDSNIRGSNRVASFLDTNILSVRVPKTIILEIKYDHFLPEIIRNIISLPCRQQTAFSKYAMTRMI